MLAITGLCLFMIGFLVDGSNAAAQTPRPRIVYTLSGATFNDGGTLSGSFIFDPNPPCPPNNCLRYSGVALTTSGGGAVYQGTLNYDDSNVIPESGGVFLLSLTPEQGLMLTVGFSAQLGATGVNLLDTDGATIQWTGTGSTRFVNSGSLVGVEEGAPPDTDPPTEVDPPTVTDPPTAVDPGTDGQSSGNGTSAGSGDSSGGGATASSPSPGAGNQELPSTGSNERTFALAGLGALALGVLLLRTSRLGHDRPST